MNTQNTKKKNILIRNNLPNNNPRKHIDERTHSQKHQFKKLIPQIAAFYILKHTQNYTHKISLWL